MVIIAAAFLFFSGIIATIGKARNNYELIKSISYFILSIGVIILSMEYFEGSDGKTHHLLPLFLISVISVHFLIGELSRKKTQIWWNFIPLASSLLLSTIPNIKEISYFNFGIDSRMEIFLIALISSAVPFLTHLAKLGIGNLIIRFGSIKWAENEENYLESLVSYAFIGGMAVFGAFLLGNLGLLIAGTFYLSASFVARNKLGLENDIISAASGSLFLIISLPILLAQAGFNQLDFTRGEVLEGAFVAGFMVIFYELLLTLARHNKGIWKAFFAFLSLFIPVIAILLLGFIYTQLERLGGVLALGGIITSLALLSVTFTLFKNSTMISLKLIAVGLSFLILPYVKPVEQPKGIDLSALGIEQNNEATDDKGTQPAGNSTKEGPKGQDIFNALGQWSIDSEASQISFELGPEDGRTKGAFKNIRGSVEIKEPLEKSAIKVTLPVISLTTFNSMRDEHLMEEDYFHEEKYPEMTFKAIGFEKDGDAYMLNGTFTMMGIEKPLKVKMKLLGVGEKDGDKKAVLWGTSQLDRTNYGMDSSEKIGDIVDFTFEVQINHEF